MLPARIETARHALPLAAMSRPLHEPARHARTLRPSARLLAALGALLALAGCSGGPGAGRDDTPPPPDRVDRIGGLEIVTHSRREAVGDGGQTGISQHWSLRWQGQPLALDSRGGPFGEQPQRLQRVNALYVIGEGEGAEVLVNVGDPNNTSAFHALRQSGGALQTPLLCIALGGDTWVAWADALQRQPLHGPRFERLSGGRWLQLGSRCLYDTRNRRVAAVPAAPEGSAVLHRLGALAIAPDGRRAAWLGQSEADIRRLQLLVADLDQPRWTVLPVDRSRMRYATLDAIDPAWVAHHFEWRRGRDGRDQLHERARFEPLPRRGRYLAPPAAQYSLEDTLAGTRHRLAAFLQQRFQAQPRPLRPHESDAFVPLLLRGEEVMVSDVSIHVTPSGKPYWPGQAGDPAVQQQLIREIGAAIDAELAAGRLRELFGS